MTLMADQCRWQQKASKYRDMSESFLTLMYTSGTVIGVVNLAGNNRNRFKVTDEPQETEYAYQLTPVCPNTRQM